MTSNMKIRTVAVLGAGAVGSYVIWGLSDQQDIRLGVIAEGERRTRLKQEGCNSILKVRSSWKKKMMEHSTIRNNRKK